MLFAFIGRPNAWLAPREREGPPRPLYGFRAQSVGVMDEFVTEYVIQMEVRTKVTFQRQPVLGDKVAYFFLFLFAQAAAIDKDRSLVSSYSKYVFSEK